MYQDSNEQLQSKLKALVGQIESQEDLLKKAPNLSNNKYKKVLEEQT